MKIFSRIILLGFFALMIAIGFNNCSPALKTQSVAALNGVPLGGNVMAVTLGGYTNEPYVSVTLCVPGTSNCVTVPHILLDSGSSGLRIFSSALSSNFISSLTSTSYAECMTYADSSVQWGPVKKADIILGQEVASAVPMQIINNSFGDGGTKCINDFTTQEKNAGTYDASNPPEFDTADPTTFNGILGVSFFFQDCGDGCAVYSNNQLYYNCIGTSCASIAVSTALQVSNPIGFLAADNNGIVIEMPSIPPNGLGNDMQGYAVLGIGTQSNNMPSSGVTVLGADTDPSDNCYTAFQTSWNGHSICGFLDSGSNALSFPNINMPTDSYLDYTPPSRQTFTATNTGYNGHSSAVQFSIANITPYFNYYNVLSYWGGDDPAGPIQGEFDWGLPFFMGRNVYVGLENRSSALGSGTYWAY